MLARLLLFLSAPDQTRSMLPVREGARQRVPPQCDIAAVGAAAQLQHLLLVPAAAAWLPPRLPLLQPPSEPAANCRRTAHAPAAHQARPHQSDNQ